MYEVDVVIVNYNTEKDIRRCLESIFNLPPAFQYRVIVVDNGSSDNSIEMIRNNFPKVLLIENESNKGLSKAINRALRTVDSKFVILMDSDTVAEKGALDILYEFMSSNDRVGSAAPRMLNVDGSFQRTARNFPSAMNALFGRQSILTRIFPGNRWSRQYLMAGDLDSTTPYQVDWAAFACIIFRAELLEKIGLMDELFFVYWVDADWCKRVNNACYKVYCVPEAKIIHVEQNKKGRKRHPGSIIDFHKGAYNFYRKHYAASPLNPMRWVAQSGLAFRTAMLLIANHFRK